MTTPSHADLMVQNLHIVTFDEDRTIISDGAIAIKDGVIADIGPVASLSERWEPDARRFANGCIAMPGLTDAHVHTAQTLMRGLITTLTLRGPMRVPLWREYLVPFESMLTPEDVHLSALYAYSSMLAAGTTTFFEAGGPHPQQMAEAAVETGIRGTVSLSTMDGGDRIPESMRMDTQQAIQHNIELVQQWPNDPAHRVDAAMSLRQVITCSQDLVTQMHAAATERDVKIHTHLVEGTYEIDFCLERFGKRPIEHLIDCGVFTPTLHCAHSIMAGPADVEAFARYGASACHCPLGNYAIGSPPALHMWRKGIPIGVGTDGIATHGSFDLFRAAQVAKLGQQHVYGTPFHDRSAVDPSEPLAMATRGGSQAMQLEQRTGSLEIGKRADLVLIDTSGASAAPYASPEAFLFESATGRDVRTVIVDGVVVVDDGKVQTVDLDWLQNQASSRQAELAKEFL